MRKFVLSALALFLSVGLVIAGQVTFVKYDAAKKELTVKDGDDKEHTYKITDKTKVKMATKDGDKDGDLEKTLKRFEKNGEKMATDKAKIEITTEKDEVTEIKLKGGKKQ